MLNINGAQPSFLLSCYDRYYEYKNFTVKDIDNTTHTMTVVVPIDTVKDVCYPDFVYTNSNIREPSNIRECFYFSQRLEHFLVGTTGVKNSYAELTIKNPASSHPTLAHLSISLTTLPEICSE